ncbi:uncharacterized protein BYT42DRAFT_560325 [Radiomyces spectabilis]|uniref:uncharacterized protein n=1 Tax=Radiomyces spectabilis TaxID=64574 RepID=UPI00221FC36D|nr:uncharacterized protein BYT42DRAFT_560325 [Radiomyces spectabilis]KAI8388517.1 hypothetical protein BYT42DRAFT_560325 [Radiomyces spectabilis]
MSMQSPALKNAIFLIESLSLGKLSPSKRKAPLVSLDHFHRCLKKAKFSPLAFIIENIWSDIQRPAANKRSISALQTPLDKSDVKKMKGWLAIEEEIREQEIPDVYMTEPMEIGSSAEEFEDELQVFAEDDYEDDDELFFDAMSLDFWENEDEDGYEDEYEYDDEDDEDELFSDVMSSETEDWGEYYSDAESFSDESENDTDEEIFVDAMTFDETAAHRFYAAIESVQIRHVETMYIMNHINFTSIV